MTTPDTLAAVVGGRGRPPAPTATDAYLAGGTHRGRHLYRATGSDYRTELPFGA